MAGLGIALPAISAATAGRAAAESPEHRFVAAPQADTDDKREYHGYPDECAAFSSFADSLVGLAHGEGWSIQPPVIGGHHALVVDFASATESEAEASLARGWNGAREFPMGVVTTVATRTWLDPQNDFVKRQLTLIAPGMTTADFHAKVTEPLLDSSNCPDEGCERCRQRTPRRLCDVFRILRRSTNAHPVYLFSRWTPGEALRTKLLESSTYIVHAPLTAIPVADIEANRGYHIWDGTPRQAREFRARVWAPSWKKGNA